MTNQKKTNIKLVGAIIITIFLFFCFSIYIINYNIFSSNLDIGSEKAKPIITALNAYKIDKGYFPSHLDELVPIYLKKIPKPGLFQDYCYDLQNMKTSYTLAFTPMGEANGDGWYYFSYKEDTWHQSDSDYSGECTFRTK
ncbi:MAG: hypothetical protein C0410_13835 [Anaerolinea sp.]|nr:hypothetical protein [Anaerolinea sp.]